MKNVQPPPSPYLGIVIITICLIGGIIYSHEHLASSIDDLYSEHYNLAGKVSGIEIKSNDTANQLMLSLENQYWSEISDSIDIAEEAGFKDYHKMVLINPDLHIVRLTNLDGDEISVNYLTKVITTYGGDY